MHIDTNWSFEQAFEQINDQYPPYGYVNPQVRNRQIEAWGQIVGRTRALNEFDKALSCHGSLTALGRYYQMSVSKLRELREFYFSLPNDQTATRDHRRKFDEVKFVIGSKVNFEETRYYEFKDISASKRPADSIKETAEEYAVAFLNCEGGVILWGVRDDQTVVGVNLNAATRDDIRKVIVCKLKTIQPHIEASAFEINFYQIYKDANSIVADLWIVALTIPNTHPAEPYFTAGGHLFIKTDAGREKVTGPALTKLIRRWDTRNNK